MARRSVGRLGPPVTLETDAGGRKPWTQSVSAVIPAYNEESYIERCVTALESALDDIAGDYEIIVVDDGSVDGTAAILDTLTRSHARLIVVHHDRNYGLGHALRSGFVASTKAITFYSDADL